MPDHRPINGRTPVRKIRVGIIGASPDRGWAGRAHVPALRALPGYELTAVATSRADSAGRAAELFGAAHAFTDQHQLAAHPEVDLVVITVKVAAHRELVQAALAAGKHVYCEWPLALTTAEAELLATAAQTAGVRTAVGLQARYAPAISHARALISEGHLGRVTSATLHTARAKGAATAVPAWTAYTYDRASGAGLLEVLGGHALDALEHLLGDIADLSATLSVQHPHHTVTETGQAIAVTSPDHLLLTATLASGAVVTAHIHDGEAAAPRTRLEIAGTKGDLAIVSAPAQSPDALQFQIGELRLRTTHGTTGTWREVPLPDQHTLPAEIEPQARNVAALYAQFATDLHTGSHHTPDFATGVRLHRLLDAIRASATTGTRQPR
ncbi:Gfo/Idh/MocA family protein [Goodfellowiella coeruleoviolacea]|uniref:Dehydrogenase n=1 Tax=Goodfellowiella coeruleoviolacea TaxID=334858 RepID=A0AAE3KFQ2_9PSEU|nr:Gfo/Idh/MocA family oxidoreductase [Goodfellowiella coeruleoviolacea]MCP2165217.1 putative dehydrogenase [Goodfellowiella coeruleoviolacea]